MLALNKVVEYLPKYTCPHPENPSSPTRQPNPFVPSWRVYQPPHHQSLAESRTLTHPPRRPTPFLLPPGVGEARVGTGRGTQPASFLTKVEVSFYNTSGDGGKPPRRVRSLWQSWFSQASTHNACLTVSFEGFMRRQNHTDRPEDLRVVINPDLPLVALPNSSQHLSPHPRRNQRQDASQQRPAPAASPA